MGSSCSILNDTEYDVWVADRINWPVLIVSVGVAAALLSGGGIAVLLVFGPAEVGVGGALAEMGGAAAIVVTIKETATAAVEAGLKASRSPLVREVLKLSIERLARALKITEKEAEELQKYVREFQAEAKLIRPGGEYTWSGILYTKRVHLMNEKLQFDNKACLTGPTHVSEKVYRISEHFTKMDVNR